MCHHLLLIRWWRFFAPMRAALLMTLTWCLFKPQLPCLHVSPRTSPTLFDVLSTTHFKFYIHNKRCHRLTLAWLLVLTLVTGCCLGELALDCPDRTSQLWRKLGLLLPRYMLVVSWWELLWSAVNSSGGENPTCHVSWTGRKPICLKHEFMLSCRSG